MEYRAVRRAAWFIAALACLLLAGQWTALPDSPASAEGVDEVSTVSGMSPIVENIGQFDPSARFRLWHGNGSTWLDEGGLWLTIFDTEAVIAAEERLAATGRRDTSIPVANFRLTFVGANPAPILEPFDALGAHVSYLIGDDPSSWRADVPAWGGVRYRNLYPGIDLVLSAPEAAAYGSLYSWYLELSGGADPRVVQMRVEGAQSVRVGEGQILANTPVGSIGVPLLGLRGGSWPKDSELKPEVAETEPGSQAFVVNAPLATDGNLMAPAAIEQPLELLYSSYLGGSDWDRGYGVAVDSSGMIYVAGRTPSEDFPTTPGAWDTTLDVLDAFVVKLNPAGSGLADLVYSTFIGGSGFDSAYGLALSGGEVSITGDTASVDFPTTAGAFDRECGSDGACNGVTDAIFARLNADGTALLYGTHIGGKEIDTGYDIAIVDGNALLTGRTYSSDFPTTSSAYDTVCGTDGRCNPVSGNAVADAFLVEIGPNGSGSNDLLYGTYVGGAAYDEANGLATAGGNAFVTGESRGAIPGFAGYAGQDDAFVAKIAPAGSGVADLVYGIHLGGTGDDLGSGIAVRGSLAFVSGETRSSDFLAGTVANSFGGGLDDAFIVQLDGFGTATYAAYLGGDDQDYGRDVAIDSSGAAVVLGYTWSLSTTFPVTEEAYDRTYNGDRDIFVARIDLTSSRPEHITYATYLGGVGEDDGVRVALDSEGLAYITGNTRSGDYPTTIGAFDRALDGIREGIITKIQVALPPALRLEKSTNGVDADESPGPYLLPDDPVTWEYVVTNTGGFVLNDLVVSDDQGVSVSCPGSTLLPEEAMTCTATGFAGEGQYSNLGTATGNPGEGFDPAVATDPSHYFGAAPAIDLEKFTNGENADEGTGPLIRAGEIVTWTYVVTNTGNVVLSDITVTDDLQGDASCPNGSLGPKQSMTCTITGTVTADQYANTATVSGIPPGGLDPVLDSDPSHYFGADPAVSLEKHTNGLDADEPPGPSILIGDLVSWSYMVANLGNVPLSGVAVFDDGGVEVDCPETELAEGGSTVCTASGIAERGQYTNTATVEATPPVGSVVTAQDLSHYFGVVPEVTIEKHTNGEDADGLPGPFIEIGGPVAWTYVVTNTGNVPLTAVEVTDNQGVAVDCPGSSLPVDEAMTCTAEGTAIVGQYGNLGTVTATAAPDGLDPVGVSDTDPSHYFGSDPSLAIRKLTNGQDADAAPGVYLLVGDAVTWTYVVTNTGNVALTDVVVGDDQPGVVVDCPGTSLAVDEAMTCTALGEAIAGQYANTGMVTGTPPVGGDAYAEDLSHYFGVDANIAIEKRTNGVDADEAPGPTIQAGTLLTWTYLVTNTGNVALTDLLVTDDQGVEIDCPTTELAVEASTVCTATGLAIVGQYTNTGTAEATPPGGLLSVSASDDSHYFGGDPAIQVEKATNGQDADAPTGPIVLVGSPVSWEYKVENVGNLPLSAIVVTDSDPDVVVECPASDLAVGESMVCTAEGTAETGQYSNTAEATGTPSDGLDDVSDTDPSHYFGADPAVSLEKHTNGQDADTAPGPSILEGDPVEWTYTVENTGNVSLSGVAVVDDQGVFVDCPETDLSVSASTVCTAAGTAISGQYTNTATVTAVPPVGPEVSAEDSSHYFGVVPGIALEKGTNGEDADSAPGPYIERGAVVSWTYVVSNTGNVPLIAIEVSDDQGVAVDCPGSSLAVREAMTCTAEGRAVSGQYGNVGTVTATAVSGELDPVVVSDSDPSHYYGSDPSLAIQKLTNGQDAYAVPGVYLLVGDTVTWTYAVTNTGNVTLTDVTVTDSRLGEITACPGSTLAVDEAMTCTATGEAVAGQYVNTGMVTGTPPVGGDAAAQDLSYYFGVDADIAIAKRTNGVDADEAPGPTIQAGTLLTWTYLVTNTGNVALTDLLVTDDQGVEIDCPTTELAVEASTVCTATGLAIVGQYTNTGTVVGSPPGGLPVVSSSDISHYFGGDPAIDVEKHTNGQDADNPTGPTIPVGMPVQWEFLVSNVGNLPLSAIEVSDSDPDITVSCPGTTLAVDESILCTAEGTAETGQYSNTATATGTPPDGLDDVSDSDDSHYIGINPAIDLEKRTNGLDADELTGPYILVDDTVTWTYHLTNTGDILLLDVAVTDDQLGDITCPRTSLGEGDSMTCTVTGGALAGQQANEGQVSAVPAGASIVVTDTDLSHYFGASLVLTIEKWTIGQDADEPPGPLVLEDSTVSWTYAIDNSSNVTLTGIVVSDDMLGTITCPQDTLRAGEGMTCSETGAAVSGQYTNTGTVTGTPPGGLDEIASSDPGHYFGVSPSLALAKRTDGLDADDPPGPYIWEGMPVKWTYSITNTGNITLTGLDLVDDKLGVVGCPNSTLAAEESMTCTTTGTAELGQYANTAEVTGSPPIGPPVSAVDDSHYFGISPSIQINKYTNGWDADSEPWPSIYAGEVVTWTYVVTNTGDITLTEVVVTDDQLGPVECPALALDPAMTMTCEVTGTAVSGTYANVGTVVGKPPGGPDVSDSDPSHYLGREAAPAIDIEKFTNGLDADAAPGPYIPVGEGVTWTYVVKNSGNVEVTSIAVIDSDLGEITCPQDILDELESMECVVTGSAVAGQYGNVATVTGMADPGSLEPVEVSDSDPSHYFGSEPSIELAKLTNGQDADVEPGIYILAGEPVTWTYRVTNTGNVKLSAVSVTDDQVEAVSCPYSVLNAGASMTCAAMGEAVAGQYANLATAQGTPAVGLVVDANDADYYFGAILAAAFEKRTNGLDADDAPGPLLPVDEAVAWTYHITSSSNVPLSVAVSDSEGVRVTCEESTVQPDGTVICSGQGTAVPGQYANTGTATLTPPGGLSPLVLGDDSHYFGSRPAVEMQKHTKGLDADEAPGPLIPVGDVVEWTYHVTNTGNITLTQLLVTDDQGVDVECPSDTLAPDKAMVCSATGAASVGQYENVGRVTGMPLVGPQVEDSDASHFFGTLPGIDLEKHTNGEDADLPPGPSLLAGQPVTWTYHVTNTGNITLTKVNVTDDQGLAVDCPHSRLGAGEAMTCSASGEAVAGQYINVGLARGTPPVGSVVSDSDPSHYSAIVAEPAIGIQKLTNGADADQAPGPYIMAGDPVEWVYLVTNAGNVLLTDIVVVDDRIGALDCPQNSLGAGEWMECRVDGIAEPDQYRNRGTVTGTPPLGSDVLDYDDSHYFGMVPGLMLSKRTNDLDADDIPGPYFVVGEPVEWTYVVTNSGNITLTQVAVIDDQRVEVSCPVDVLGAGESMTCTAEGSAVVGQYGNVGVVEGQPPEGESISATDASHYFGISPRIELEKHTNGVDADESPGPEVLEGLSVQWTYVVSNTGDVELTGVTVSDDQAIEPVCPQNSLVPGEKMTCTASSVSVVGQYANIGSATATHPGGGIVYASDPSHYLGIALRPVVDVQKRTNGLDADLSPGPYIPVGDPVEWEYLVTNSGNVTLVELTVVDDQGVNIACPGESLAALDSMICTGSGIAVAGQYTNVVTTTGVVLRTGEIISDTDPSHYFGSLPGIELEKLTNGLDADDAPGPRLTAGETVTWSYRVTNTGNVPLTGVAVTDDREVRVSCSSTALAVSATMTCTATGQVQVGQYVNIGSVVGTFGTEVVMDSDPSHYYGLYTIYLPLVVR